MVKSQASKSVIALAAESVRMDFREGVPERYCDGLFYLRGEGIYPSRKGNCIKFFRMTKNESGVWVKAILDI